MFAREEIRERIRGYLDECPPAMTRRQVEEFIDQALRKALVLEDDARIYMAWNRDSRLRVELPSRLHYFDSLEDIALAIREAVGRIDVNDAVSLSPEEFTDRMARLRGRK